MSSPDHQVALRLDIIIRQFEQLDFHPKLMRACACERCRLDSRIRRGIRVSELAPRSHSTELLWPEDHPRTDYVAFTAEEADALFSGFQLVRSLRNQVETLLNDIETVLDAGQEPATLDEAIRRRLAAERPTPRRLKRGTPTERTDR